MISTAALLSIAGGRPTPPAFRRAGTSSSAGGSCGRAGEQGGKKPSRRRLCETSGCRRGDGRQGASPPD